MMEDRRWYSPGSVSDLRFTESAHGGDSGRSHSLDCTESLIL